MIKLTKTKKDFIKDEKNMMNLLTALHNKFYNFLKKSPLFTLVYDNLFYNKVSVKRSAIVDNFHIFFNLLFLLLLAEWIKQWGLNWGVDFNNLTGIQSAIIIYPYMDAAVCLVFFATFLMMSRFWIAIAFIVSFNSLIHLTGLYLVFESNFIPFYIKQYIYITKWIIIFLCTPIFMWIFNKQNTRG